MFKSKSFRKNNNTTNRRFDFDAAIIFSDILMIPYGLGQDVEFKKNFGPSLGKINIAEILETEEIFLQISYRQFINFYKI